MVEVMHVRHENGIDTHDVFNRQGQFDQRIGKSLYGEGIEGVLPFGAKNGSIRKRRPPKVTMLVAPRICWNSMILSLL